MATISVHGRGEVTVSESLSAVLSDWRTASIATFGFDVPVVLIDRHSVRVLDQYPGEMNTAYFCTPQHNTILAVALETIDPINEVLVAHEVIHFILHLEGFHGVRCREFPLTCNLLSSLASHVPLNQKMRQHGFNYVQLEDLRAKDSVTALSRTPPAILGKELPTGGIGLKNAALYLCDVLSCCSATAKEDLESVISRHTEVHGLISLAVSSMAYYDLSSPRGNEKFLRRIVKEFKLKKFGGFSVHLSLAELRGQVKNPS